MTQQQITEIQQFAAVVIGAFMIGYAIVAAIVLYVDYREFKERIGKP